MPVSIEEAKETIEEGEAQDVEVEETHQDCGTHLILTSDLEEQGGGYVLLCPGCLERVRKV